MDNVALARRMFARLEDDFDQRDHGSFYDLLAEDVVMKYGVCREGTPISCEFKGKQAVIDLQSSLRLVEEHWLDGPVDYVGSGDRVVALGRESYTIEKTGAGIRNRDFAIVLDFRDGLITRILQIKEWSELMDSFFHG